MPSRPFSSLPLIFSMQRPPAQLDLSVWERRLHFCDVCRVSVQKVSGKTINVVDW